MRSEVHTFGRMVVLSAMTRIMCEEQGVQLDSLESRKYVK